MSSMFPSPVRRRRSVAGMIVLGSICVGAGIWLWPRGSGGDGDRPPDLRSNAPPSPQEATVAPTPAPAPAPAPAPELRPAVAASSTLGPEEAEAEARERVKKAEAAGDAPVLRKLLGTYVLDEGLPAALREEWLARADDLNRRLVWSAAPGPGFFSAEVRRGDSYWKICERLRKERGLKFSAALLEAINHVPVSRLRSDRPVKVPEEPLAVIVDKSEFRLYLVLGGAYLLHWPVGIGRNGLTPEGAFTIGGKMAKPLWTDPKTGKNIRYGEPGHLIGSRWLALLEGGKKTSYGLHGTIEPASIGTAASDGCVRLKNEDVERLYDLVPEGIEVRIRP